MEHTIFKEALERTRQSVANLELRYDMNPDLYPKGMRNSNPDSLITAMAGLKEHERNQFLRYLIGHLATLVTKEHWEEALAHAGRLLERNKNAGLTQEKR